MAYTPNEWACGDTLTAEKLNNIERGISEMNSEYVPTEWQCGDTITAEKLNKIEQGIANAGGGSSDFSTAEVTISGGIASNAFPVYENERIDVRYAGNESITVIIGADGLAVNPPDGYTSTSGAIQSLGKEGYLITGDCTITIS